MSVKEHKLIGRTEYSDGSSDDEKVKAPELMAVKEPVLISDDTLGDEKVNRRLMKLKEQLC